MASAETDPIFYDLEFLIRAANYNGARDAPYSEAARKAVDVAAERLRLILDMKLKIVQEQLKLIDPVEKAKEFDARGLGVE